MGVWAGVLVLLVTELLDICHANPLPYTYEQCHNCYDGIKAEVDNYYADRCIGHMKQCKCREGTFNPSPDREDQCFACNTARRFENVHKRYGLCPNQDSDRCTYDYTQCPEGQYRVGCGGQIDAPAGDDRENDGRVIPGFSPGTCQECPVCDGANQYRPACGRTNFLAFEGFCDPCPTCAADQYSLRHDLGFSAFSSGSGLSSIENKSRVG